MRRVGLALIALLLVTMLVVVPLLTRAAATPGPSTTIDAQKQAQGNELVDAEGPVVLIGTAGVRWDDLSAVATPHMWELAERGGVANLVTRSVRSSSCPVDGWLALSAGRRAADVPAEEYGVCRQMHDVDDGQVPAWSEYLEEAEDASYDAHLGAFHELLEQAGKEAVALGPGAAIALASSDGDLDFPYVSRSGLGRGMSEEASAELADSDLLVVDVGAVRDRDRPQVEAEDPRFAGGLPEDEDEAVPDEADWPLVGPDRVEQVARVDKRIGAVINAVQSAEGPEPTVLFASLADSGTTPTMQVLAAAGDGYPASLLSTQSTRQPGMAQTTDLSPTLLDLLGVPVPGSLSGAPVYSDDASGTGAGRIARLVDENHHGQAVRPLSAPFISALVLINLALYASVTVGLNRRVIDRFSSWLDNRRSTTWRDLAARMRMPNPQSALQALRAVSLTVAALPVASYLANLVPWWRATAPGLVVVAATLVIAVLIAAIALGRPWRYRSMVPMGIVAGLTMLVLGVDALLGARLQLSAVLGVQPQVGGRFYGFNNSSFALWAAASVIVAACLAEPLVRRGRRKWAALLVGGIGLIATVLDGLPAIGADFGGPPAIIPAFIIMMLLALGIRLTWQRVVVTLGATAVISVGFAVLDWLRPPAERSHLGRFIDTVLDGGLINVIGRKLGQNLANLFGSTLTFMAIGGIALVLLIILRPLRRAANQSDTGAYSWLIGGSALRLFDTDARMLRPTLVGLGVSMGIGFAVNDSGIVIPAMGVALAVPLLIALLTTWLLAARSADDDPLLADSR